MKGISRFPQGYQPIICTVESCDRKVVAQGWCKSHYRRWLRYGNPEASGFALCSRCREHQYRITIGHHMCGYCWKIFQRQKTSWEHSPPRRQGTPGDPFWTKEYCIKAGEQWLEEYDMFPTVRNWNRRTNPQIYPSSRTIMTKFGSWNDFVIALKLQPNPHTTLNATQVQEIRRRYAAGGISQTKLAQEYGCWQIAIFKILHYQTWKDI